MLIEITEKHPAAPGKKVATIVAAGGHKFDIWPENLTNIQVGGRYEVEVTDREYKGRIYRKITKATPVNGVSNSPAPQHSASKPQPNGNGNGYCWPTSPVDSEQNFVCATLCAFIKVGKIEPELNKVANAITVLRQAYQRGFAAAE